MDDREKWSVPTVLLFLGGFFFHSLHPVKRDEQLVVPQNSWSREIGPDWEHLLMLMKCSLHKQSNWNQCEHLLGIASQGVHKLVLKSQ